MITLRQWPHGSRELLNELYAECDQSMCLVRLPVPLPKEETDRYMHIIETGNNQGRPFLCFGIYLDDRLIGKTELTRYEEGSAEADIIIQRDYCSKGYGTQALQELISTARAEEWCERIIAYIDLQNRAALKLFAKAGFQKGRTFRADVAVYEQGSLRVETHSGLECVKELQI